jgi:hypothetical protein
LGIPQHTPHLGVHFIAKYNQNDQAKQDEIGRKCGTHEEKRNTYKGLAGKPEGNGSPRRSWEDNNKMNLREVRWGDMYWINLAQDRYHWRALVNVVMNIRVP